MRSVSAIASSQIPPAGDALNDQPCRGLLAPCARLLTGNFQSDEQRIEAAYARALSRAPKDKEKQSLLEFLKSQREYYNPNAEEAAKLLKTGIVPVPAPIKAPELAAWTQVCRVVLNLHETITRY